MKNVANYILDTEDGERVITITPIHQTIPGGNLYATGVFRLNEGNVGMGDIVFDDDMKQWEYTGMGELSHEEAAAIALYIKDYNED